MDRVSLTADLKELRIKETLSSHPWLLVCDKSFNALFRDWGVDPARLIAVDELEDSIEEASAYKFAVICTERPEGPTQKLLKMHGVSSTGLYSQMVPRLAAGVGPRFYAPPDTKADLEFAIMCLPRCGSTLVSRELRQIGAGNPVEHFRGFLHDLLKEREASKFDLIKWWSLVRSGRQDDGVFSTKIIYDFWKMAEKYMLQEEKAHMLGFLKSVPIVYIERTDKYAQAISDVIARKTGVWHLWNDGMKQTYQGKLREVGVDLAEATTSYKKFRRSERELAAFIKANSGSIIKIDYEDLIQAPKATIADVGRRLGLSIPDDYLESPLSLQPTTSETHTLLRDRLKAELE